MGRGSSKVGNGNSHFKGFSVTQNGKTSYYMVDRNGQVQYADGSPRNAPNPFTTGFDKLELFQRAYEMSGNSTNGLIDRINKIGQAKATTLSDKEVLRLQEERRKRRKKAEKEATKTSVKSGSVNRHRTYWSKMGY